MDGLPHFLKMGSVRELWGMTPPPSDVAISLLLLFDNISNEEKSQSKRWGGFKDLCYNITDGNIFE